MQKRSFIKSLGLGLMGLPLISSAGPFTSKKPTILPKPIPAGGTIGIVSPSAATADRMQFQFAKETFEELGYQVVLGKHVKSRRGHLAGTDQDRADDLNDMFRNSAIDAIVCIRGGSGAARILPLLDYQMIQQNPKPLLGYSDVTALHAALYSQTGLISFHGPNGTGSWNSFNVKQFESIFVNKILHDFANEQVKGDDLIVKNNRTSTIYSGVVKGRILGGNLTVLSSLSGTSYYPDFSDAILFVEDIGEDPYKIDRMMSTLRLNGTLSKIKGFIFGQCTDCNPSGGFGSLTLDELWEDYILPLEIPAYKGAMIGHIPKQFIIPHGAIVTMDADKGSFQLTQTIFQ
ncbi:S66 peptidase family protein [Mongoliitalea daihaiensis]|uniref:S66 peptidase family protein n=1 Tax=Mongoliitalea daihaiensis TaxID=2782006 RepID=UPI001F21BBA5|nr:LD-carboxypeptidase [Mongoliitalea daihaiensis]UJP63590.1 LD-carboxypeptidase [Mongoliitalea daihaiensis]